MPRRLSRIVAFLSNHRLAVAVFATAFLVRFVYLVSYSKSPFFQVHIADALYHEQWARRILDGDLFSQKIEGSLYKPPLYPYFLAFGYWLSGMGNFLPAFLQVLMGALSCVLLYLIGKRYFGAAAAFLGALVFTFYFPSVYFSAELEVPTLSILLTLLSYYLLLLGPNQRRVIASAVTFGLSLLALPTNALLLPVYALLLMGGRTADGKRILATHRTRNAGLFAAIVVLAITPTVLNNSLAQHRLTFVSSNGGINLYIGNNPHYDETVYLQPGYAFEDFYDEPRRVAGASTFAQRDRYWYGKALHFMVSQPKKELSLVLKKVALYFADYEIYRNTDTYYAKANSIYRRIPFVPAAVILATGIMGAILTLRNRKNRELFAFCILLAAPPIIFFVTDRYRLPSMALWSLFSGIFLVHVVDRVRAKAWDSLALEGVSAVGLVVLSNLNLFVIKNPEYRPHLNLGFIHESRAEYERAVKEYSTALRLVQPKDTKTISELHARLGNVHMTTGNLDEARHHFDEALRANPNSGPVYSYFGALYDKTMQGELAVNMYRRALELNPWDAVSLHNLGLFYIHNDQFDEAVAEFGRALTLNPEDAQTRSDLAYAYGRLGRLDLMEREAKRAIDSDPKDAAPRYNLAVAYLNTGRMADAIAQYRQIAEIAPSQASNAFNQLGVIDAQKGDLTSAIANWEKALEIDPNNTSAHANIERAKHLH